MKRKKIHRSQSGPPDLERSISRRAALKGALGLGAMAALSSCAYVEKDSGSVTKKTILGQADLIRRENEKPGTRDWLLTNTRIDPTTKYRCPWIEGYSSHTSARAGETIDFKISTNPASEFTVDVFRLGYYGGAGGRAGASPGATKGITQSDPPIGTKRVRDCQWSTSHRLKIQRDWPRRRNDRLK